MSPNLVTSKPMKLLSSPKTPEGNGSTSKNFFWKDPTRTAVNSIPEKNSAAGNFGYLKALHVTNLT